MVKVILDVYGADNSPHEIIKGAVDAVNKDSDIKVVLCGKQDEMMGVLSGMTYNPDSIEILDADEVVTNYDKPTEAIRVKKNSSLVRALETLKSDEQACAVVSAGSTGAVLTGAIFIVGRIKGVQRPALAPIMPTAKRTFSCVVDCGANVDCKPHFLSAFAVMGTAYMRALFDMKSPRVALLSNGVEEKKGNELVQESFKLLKEIEGINFVGNMEAREALSGDYEVIVTDGFAGNVLIKSIEGTGKLFGEMLKDEIMSSTSAKIGYLFMKKAMKSFKSRMDTDAYGGAPFLGVNKLVIKAHGSAKAKSICASILQAKRLHESNFIEKMRADLESAGIEIRRDV